MALNLMNDVFWVDKFRFNDAERLYNEKLWKKESCKAASNPCQDSKHNVKPISSVVDQIVHVREEIEKTLTVKTVSFSDMASEAMQRLDIVEKQNQEILSRIQSINSLVNSLQEKVGNLEKQTTKVNVEETDDIDLFGSDSEDEEAIKVKEERLKAYAEKKQKKPALIAKSNVIFEVKPWDDETDMKKLEECVRSISLDGLLWGSSKLVPVGYGINKLQIVSVIEDDKVSTEDLQEKITAFEDYIQSVDIAAFNKI